MLGAVGIVAEQNDLSACGHHKDDPDHRLLKAGEAALSPNQEGGCNEGGGDSTDLDRPAVGLPAHRVGSDHSEPGDLGDRQIDEDDPALEHELAQRHMRRKYQQPRQKCGKQNFEINTSLIERCPSMELRPFAGVNKS
jgi:hypothetical protein